MRLNDPRWKQAATMTPEELREFRTLAKLTQTGLVRDLQSAVHATRLLLENQERMLKEANEVLEMIQNIK